MGNCFGEAQVLIGAVILYSILAATAAWAQGVVSQAGFISIDCGATESRVDPATGIRWVPDTNYTSTGVSFDGVPGTAGFLLKYPFSSTLRYFPNLQTKYCYELPATPNSTYLVRHSYWFGSYDGNAKHPSFSVALDTNMVATIDTTSYSLPVGLEVIYKARGDAISFCLYRDDTNSTPFLSALELRPFKPGAYEQQHLVEGGGFLNFLRFDLGGSLGQILRFPDDEYDRAWFGYSDGAIIETTYSVDPNNLPLSPPSTAMQTGQTSASLGPATYMKQFLSRITGSVKTCINLYFAEIGLNSSATSRSFTINVGDAVPVIHNIYADAGGPLKASVKSLVNVVLDGTSEITLVPTAKSTEPPLLNAVEILMMLPMSLISTAAGDVFALKQIKQAFGLTLVSAGDPCLPVPYDWVTCSAGDIPRVTSVKLSYYNLTGQIPAAFNSLSALKSLWLDHNALTGPIPNFSNLTSLKLLHLGNNALNGSIPDSLGTLPLTELHLENNKFVGLVPASLKSNTSLKLYISGNPGLTDPDVYSGPSPSPSQPGDPNGIGPNGGTKTKSNVALIAGIIGGIVATIVLIGCIAVLFWIRRRKHASLPNDKNLQESGPKPIQSGLVPGAQRYSLAQIKAATNNSKNKIGSGGFGAVYYGKLSNGEEVAVKESDENSQQGPQEFVNEVELLSRIHHKNLVILLGYCEEKNRQMLVYEFLHKGTLQEHLYGSIKAIQEPLGWKLRLNIALNAAQGLDYLHHGCNPNIIHRDIKSNNILLTHNYVAKVADFGLSKLAPDAESHIVTAVKGTLGYLDPEYHNTNALTEKSDVFSFGVVLLEILCGRTPVDTSIPDQAQWNLANWVRVSLQSGNIESVLDPVIVRDSPDMDVVWKVAELALQCVEPKGKHRPSMEVVVRELRETIDLNASNSYHNSTQASSGSLPSVYDSNISVMRPHIR